MSSHGVRACSGDERELWRTFMEDFNTCTLPERKYYDLAAHARKLARAAAAAGAPEDANTFVDDERLRRYASAARRALLAAVPASSRPCVLSGLVIVSCALAINAHTKLCVF